MRTFGYSVVGYFLLSFMAMGLAFACQDPSGPLMPAAGGGGFVWLMRHYRGGKFSETIRRDDAARVETFERRLGARAPALVDGLPADPLELPWMVDLEYAYRDDAAERVRLEHESERIPAGAAQCRGELDRLRRDRAVRRTAARRLARSRRQLGTLSPSAPHWANMSKSV
jgi:hypothetical protein